MRIIRFIILGLIFWLLVLVPAGFCGVKDHEPPPVKPNEVILFENSDYTGMAISVKLTKGLRHRLVNLVGTYHYLKNNIGSLCIGNEVAVVFFNELNFKDCLPVIRKSKSIVRSTFKPIISSFIVFPSDLDFPDGFTLKNGEWSNRLEPGDIGKIGKALGRHCQFLPLSEQLSHREAKFPFLAAFNDKTVAIEPHSHDISCKLFEHHKFAGRQVEIPPPSLIIKEGFVRLRKLSFENIASSAIVKKTGIQQAIVHGVVIPDAIKMMEYKSMFKPGTNKILETTPMIPGGKIASIPNLAGIWESNIGLKYQITQKGKNFKWIVATINQNGWGTIEGKKVSASWEEKNVLEKIKADGVVEIIDKNGVAKRIKWINGVIFFR